MQGALALSLFSGDKVELDAAALGLDADWRRTRPAKEHAGSNRVAIDEQSGRAGATLDPNSQVGAGPVGGKSWAGERRQDDGKQPRSETVASPEMSGKAEVRGTIEKFQHPGEGVFQGG
jgi:hypothetical protein